ncbi:MAG: hypothetical protein EAZ21_06110 [Betaproteobacteria bacterium]|nr:MAG: hypothetical protein EAZ21_06110 [Betaproteobacteria bacterium]
MNATLSYTEQLLAQMHTRALRGVVLALFISFIFHLGITLVKLGGDSFAIRFDAPVKSGDALKAQIRIQPQLASPATPQVTTPSTTPAPPTPPPVLRDRASVNLVERDTIKPIEAVPPTIAPTEPIPMPTPLPEPVTRRFETDRNNSPTRVERSERLPNVAPPQTVPLLDLKPLPPLDITPAKREPIPQKPLESAKPIEPPKAITEPAPAPANERVTAEAPKEAPKAAANEAAKSAPSEPARDAAPSTPQNTPAAAAPTQPAAPTPAPAAAAPVTAQPSIPSAATPVLSAPSSPAAAAQSASSSPSGSAASAPGAPRGASVTLPGSGSLGSAGATGGASPAREGASAGSREGTGLRPGFIDGFDADAARRNAARDAARELNSRRSLVPPSVAPSPTAREREAKAIEEAVREDCKDKMLRDPNLLAVPLIVAGQLLDKGCRIR